MARYSNRTIRLTRRGLTLVELLIAMVVLLVGVYTVASGFPRMLFAIRGEGDRTGMTRLAEQAMTRLSDNQYGLPDAITGGGSLDPRSVPEDLTAPHESLNAFEDIGEVRGETFRVPAPGAASGMGYGYYALAQGPADCIDWVAGYPYVYMLVPLAERDDDPRAADAVPRQSNWFYVDRDSGEIVAPQVVTTTDGPQARRWGTGGLPGVSKIVVDYAWTYPVSGDSEPVVRHVQSETPSDLDSATYAGQLVATVHPANLGGGINILPGQTRAWARVDFTPEPDHTLMTPASAGTFVLDRKYGATLCFHPADTGLTLKVDYQLRTYMTAEDLDAQTAGETVYPRRLPLMVEDAVIERQVGRTDTAGVDHTLIRLAVKGLDDAPVFDRYLDPAIAGAPAVHVLAVDLQTGETHVDDGTGGDPITLGEHDNFDPVLNGYLDGTVAVPIADSLGDKSYLSHTWRFYYRTLNRHAVQTQKAPRYYVDSETARAYLAAYLPSGEDEATSLAEVDYRTYQLTHVAAPNDANRRLGVLEFGQWLSGETWSTAESSAGETVAVSYAYVRVPQEREYVWGELHTVPVGGREVTLNHATLAGHPLEVLAVNGVSARAKAYWLNRAGRQLVLDVETLFLAHALGAVARVQ